MRKRFLLFIYLLCIFNSINADNLDVFYSKTVEGVYVRYMITGTGVEVGSSRVGYYANEPCISTSTEGSVTIPAEVTYKGVTYTVTSININAFADCTNLTSIILPESIGSIGKNAFKNCSALESINLPNSIYYMGSSVFSGCSSIKYISMPSNEHMRTIGDYFFEKCQSLTSVSIPSNIQTIEKYAFYECQSLGSIQLPLGLTVLEEGVFERCTSLSEIEIPANVCNIGNYALKLCPITNITLPEILVSIGDEAFSQTMITEMEIPDNVQDIGAGAFKNCGELISVKISNNVSVIKNETFSGCYSLKSVEIPQNVTEIASGTFSYCTNLTSVVIHGDIIIGDKAFAMCRSLKDISLEGEEVTIHEYAFSNCNTVENIHLKMKNPQNPSLDLINTLKTNKNATLYVPYSRSSVYNETNWCKMPSMVEENPCMNDIFTVPLVVMGDVIETDYKVTKDSPLEVQIGNGSSVAISTGTTDEYLIPERVEGPDGTAFMITSIGKNAFNGCNLLTSVSIPKSITKIANAFIDDENLKSVFVCWRKPADIEIAEENFNQLSPDATLYVPAGTAERYAEHEVWGKFGNIVEASPISVGDISARYGSNATLPIYLKNDKQIAGLQFRLTLPKGISVVEENKSLMASTTERTNGFTIMGQKDPDEENTYIFVLLSLKGTPIAGNEGSIMNIKLNIAEEAPIGNYEMNIDDVILTSVSFVENAPEGSYSYLTVTDTLMGDVNADGVVNVTDAIGVISYILEDTPAWFMEPAADVNGDGQINVTDVIGIIDIIMSQQ